MGKLTLVGCLMPKSSFYLYPWVCMCVKRLRGAPVSLLMFLFKFVNAFVILAFKFIFGDAQIFAGLSFNHTQHNN